MTIKAKSLGFAAWAVVFAIILLLVGCSSGAKEPTEPGQSAPESPSRNTTPVTLSLYQIGAGLSDEQFEQFFVKTLQAKMPYITLNLVRDAQGSRPEDLISSGTFPDLIFTANPRFREFQNLQLVHPLDDFIRKNQTQLTIYDPRAVETIRNYSANKEMIAMPFAQNLPALFYNKDIFNKFAVPYPTDGMDWEQAMQLARRIARVDDGKQIRGLEVIDARQLGSPLSLPWVNQPAMTAAINSSGWQRVFQLIRDINTIPNNETPAADYAQNFPNFITHQRVAMLPIWVNGMSIQLEDAHKKGAGFNWDIVTLPNFKEVVGTGREFDIHALMVSSTSKHKEQAFDVIEYITSEAVQFIVTGTGRVAAVNTPELQKAYAANMESFKGKNIAAIFKNTPARLNSPTDFDAIVIRNLGEASRRIVTTSDDINTIMREQEEKANQEIAAEKEKLK